MMVAYYLVLFQVDMGVKKPRVETTIQTKPASKLVAQAFGSDVRNRGMCSMNYMCT